jgi:hypothetical protein
MKNITLAVLVSTVVLFMWNGLVQFFPWGIPTTQILNTQAGNTIDVKEMKNVIALPANSLTTNEFDEKCNNKISTLITDKTFSWIIATPTNKYNMGTYFMKEAFTQLLVAIFLCLLLYYTVSLGFTTRLKIVTLAAFAAAIATYGQQLNWWGLPASYGLGVMINLILGWLLAAFIVAKWIIKSK